MYELYIYLLGEVPQLLIYKIRRRSLRTCEQLRSAFRERHSVRCIGERESASESYLQKIPKVSSFAN